MAIRDEPCRFFRSHRQFRLAPARGEQLAPRTIPPGMLSAEWCIADALSRGPDHSGVPLLQSFRGAVARSEFGCHEIPQQCCPNLHAVLRVHHLTVHLSLPD